MRRRKVIKRFLVYLLVRLLVAFFLVLPLRLALALGAAAGRLAFLLDRADRRRAIRQVGEALALDPWAALRVARASFTNAGRVAAEIALLPRLRRRFADYVELPPEAKAVLAAALAEGRGALFVSAHLGSFELLAQRIAHEGFDCATFARPSPNPFLGRWLVARRHAGRVESIERGDPSGARQLLAAIRRGAVLGALIDQDTRVDSAHVPFFGRLASTPTAPAALALSRGLPVVFGTIRRRPGGPGHVIALQPVALPEGDAVAATARLSALIEAAIRERPEEWVWFHARWKTAPPELPAVAPTREG